MPRVVGGRSGVHEGRAGACVVVVKMANLLALALALRLQGIAAHLTELPQPNLHTVDADSNDPATVSDDDEHLVYVSASPAQGSAVADGSAGAPFPTIENARDHLRALRAASTHGDRRHRVVIRAGTYPPFQLEAQDSGSPGLPIIYEADASRGPVVVSGGIQVPKSAFEEWAGHPGVLKADLSKLGIDYGSITAGGDCGGNCTGFAKAGLVFANRSMVLARWPNIDNVTGKYAWEMVKIGGPNGFSVKDDPAVVARNSNLLHETVPSVDRASGRWAGRISPLPLRPG